MERLIEIIVLCSGLTAPMLTILATASLYTRPEGCECPVAQLLFFFALLFVSGLTIRCVMLDDGAWLTQAASLGVLIVAGVLRKPNSYKQAQDASMLLQ